MTLVGPNEENVLPVMLSVQQQQHHHHHHRHGLHHSSNALQTHRGNVIVSTTSVSSGNDVKPFQQQQQQQHGCKRSKIYGQSTGAYGTVPHQPASVARRNARERNRVKQVNNGFATLRQHIPQSVAQALGGNTAGTHGGSRAGSKKLSKVETLRMAVEYIRSLQRLLEEHDETQNVTSSSSSTSTDSQSCAAEMRLRSGGDLRQATSQQQHLRQNASPTFIQAPCSEASSSPTPSFISETSSAGSQGYGPSSGSALYTTHSDSYDNCEPMSPEDEELLDVISWWQSQ